MDTIDFIKKAREVHGDKYDYSKVEYKNSHTKVCIICPIHGEFWQTPNNHISGKQGCRKCSDIKSSKKRSKTNEEFLKEIYAVHGDKYDYSKVEYKNNHTKICIICHKIDGITGKEHGEFWITPTKFLKGQGCKKCADLKQSLNQTLTTEEFIKRAKKVHEDKYDYSKVEYKKSTIKVCIICPIHGEFWQTPANHISGQGCPKCGDNKISVKLRKGKEQFIKKAREIHGDKYDYSKVEYVNSKTKVCIICPEHGEFWQTPANHIYLFQGCPECVKSKIEEKTALMLLNNNIQYVHKATSSIIPWIGKQHLDFYLPEYNVAIECQGEQHFGAVRFGGISQKKAEENFEKQKKLDEKKRNLCKENNVKLFYVDFDEDISVKVNHILKIMHNI